MPQRPENKQTLPNDESKNTIMFTDGAGVQNSIPHLNASENTTKKSSIDGAAKTEPPREC